MLKFSMLTVIAGAACFSALTSLTASAADTAVSLKAYQATQQGPALTLSAAVAEAIDDNPALAAQRAQVTKYEGDYLHADRPVPSNPELGLQAARRANGGRVSTDYGIALSQEFWTAGKGQLSSAVVKNRLSATRKDYEFLKLAIAARVRSAFFRVLLAREELATAKRSVALMQKTSDLMRISLQQGKRNRIDLNTAVIGLARARSQQATARQKLSVSRLALTDVLGRDPLDAPDVTGDIAVDVGNLPPRDKLLGIAVARRSDLAAAADRISSAKSAVELAQAQTTPNLRVFGFFNREERSNVAGAGVSVPLTVLHRYTGERKRAAAELYQAQVAKERLQRTIRSRVLEAIARFEAARTKLKQMNDSILRRSEETLRLMQRALQAGKVGSSDVLAAQDNLIAVRKEYLQVQDDYVEAVQMLEISTGGAVSLGEVNSPGLAASGVTRSNQTNSR